jgi:2-polyprenyl-6-methoxyphenol hydroxylase-like FAD-dependent oxidoreductase
MSTLATTCCIAGGGPAGMMAGLLLARAGVEVVVLEKHADFLRDFRGDTIHPSTLEVMHELGLLEGLLGLPHNDAHELVGKVGDLVVHIADFSHLPTRCKFVTFMPQWDFLDFLAAHAKTYPTFRLVMRGTASGLVEEEGRVVGVQATTADGPLEIRAKLVIAADGRHSDLRAAAGLKVDDFGAPMDVLWFRLSRAPADPDNTGGYVQAGLVFVTLNRGDYWQCAFVIPKGSIESLRARGIAAVRETVAAAAPFLHDRVDELAGFDDLKLLTVTVDRMPVWHRPGLLCIGDAAHAMSPIGGVGINLAIQDAVATANLLAGPLRDGTLGDADVARVQKRREFPARFTQAMQLAVQKRVISPVLASRGTIKPPMLLTLFNRFPFLRRIPARLVGMGVRPEHARTPDVFASDA